MLRKKLLAIEFRVLGPNDIRKMSALEIKNPETYDKDGFPMESGLMDPHLGVINPGLRCKTCGQRMKNCPGHFGHLELIRPVVHSEFSKKLEMLMHATCMACGRIALPEEKISELRAYIGQEDIDIEKKIVSKTKKVKKCPHCGAERGTILLDKPTNFFLEKERIYPTQIREWVEKIPNSDLLFFGYDQNRLRPEWFVLTVMQVPPITIRPSITLETGIKSEDDLTHKLVDIIRINLRLKDNIEAGAPQLIIEDLWDLLQYHATTYFNNNTAGVPSAKHRNGRALRTIVQRLQGKKGRFRYNLTGKRVNFAARSIITPDSNISINEVGVPEQVAETLTVPEFVTEFNLKDITQLIKDGKAAYVFRPNGMRKKITDENKEDLLKELGPGFRVERALQNGDIVLFNRQPSLHRLSMLAHRVKILPGKTFRLNPVVCKPYNADFDGDEMNLHVPQTPEGIAEARELMLVEKQVISPRHGGPVIILDEDGVSGAFILTLKTTKFPRETAMRYFHIIGIEEIPKPDVGKDHYSGRLIFSQLLPKDLNLEYKTRAYTLLEKINPSDKDLRKKIEDYAVVKIKDGQLVSGVIDDKSLGEVKGTLVKVLAREYGPEAITNFYDKLCRIAEDVVSVLGMTVSLDEYETSDAVGRVREKAVKEEIDEAEELIKQFRKGTLEHIPGRTLEESFELNMMRLGARIKDKVEKQIMQEKVGEIFGETPRYNTTAMILSGSRGSSMNLTNISGLWGQASVREGRPRKGFKDRLIAVNKKKDVGVIAGGFIEHNFMQGMNALEYFYHAMGGRQGEVDTGVSTKVSGYLYRRLANSLKDLVVNNDSTVRTASKDIIQFIYGEDGVFPDKVSNGKTLDVAREVAKLKASRK
ncbi:MAG: DNA-directed RNA polymerase subunit A' [archaeon GW2011_AR10]|uniref:DNA-directed RNA polymerase subunit n=1 Tax=Candidatus Iainarchaeum sp. TaxID=3101447 RepID=A0A7J4IS17_9ARCH|nr:MAG: DNA-directed RNA polymerase subunit A' [archaeon GW2011_AR10]HIH08311.1 DNA-directed RNA polymerase subunit A' [Candidatus Diapherotrites archaeon]